MENMSWHSLQCYNAIPRMQVYIQDTFGNVSEEDWHFYADIAFKRYFNTWDVRVDSCCNVDKQLPSIQFTWFYRKHLGGIDYQPIKIVRAIHKYVFSKIPLTDYQS